LSQPKRFANNEGTARALVRRGLIIQTTVGSVWPLYSITDEGRAAIAKAKGE
jgi:hypothetical protein